MWSLAGLPWWLRSKESVCNSGGLGLIPGLGRCPGERNGYSRLESSWWAMVHGSQRVRHDRAAKLSPLSQKVMRVSMDPRDWQAQQSVVSANLISK